MARLGDVSWRIQSRTEKNAWKRVRDLIMSDASYTVENLTTDPVRQALVFKSLIQQQIWSEW